MAKSNNILIKWIGGVTTLRGNAMTPLMETWTQVLSHGPGQNHALIRKAA